MFRHVVLFRWGSEATAEARAAVVEGLRELPGAIGEIVDYRFGPDVGLRDSNWDFVVVADFADADAYVVYRDHPAHTELIAERIAPIVAERAAVQYQLDG